MAYLNGMVTDKTPSLPRAVNRVNPIGFRVKWVGLVGFFRKNIHPKPDHNKVRVSRVRVCRVGLVGLRLKCKMNLCCAILIHNPHV